ncbi:MAG TPA: ribosome small subunit-dependent GTPase A [Anaeromyxobacter sp.]|nr:ribosome small subunit-dependent GTPase A [Anaeromyxobacter sp.]
MSNLETLGWGPFFSSQLAPEEALTLSPGRAVADRGPRLAVRFEDGERLVTVPGRLRAAGEVPVVGDFVLAPPGDDPPIARVLERRSLLSRNGAGRETAEQVLAANVDVVLLVQGLDEGVNPRRLERTLAAVYAGGAVPAVVLTKPDLVPDPGAALGEAAAVARGAPVLAASGLTGEGMEDVARLLAPGRTGVFVGPSGAGKSTLVNALLGAEIQVTAAVREHDARGRHATTGRRLFLLAGGGAVIDGPGIRELRLWDAGGLGAAFDDVAALAERCRFRDCRHDGEPGCAVVAAVEGGALDRARLESLRKLEREIEVQEARRGGAAARVEKQRWKGIKRELRRVYRNRGRE